jgi:hypothetical protein
VPQCFVEREVAVNLILLQLYMPNVVPYQITAPIDQILKQIIASKFIAIVVTPPTFSGLIIEST